MTLIWVTVTMVLISGLVVTGMARMRSSSQDMAVAFAAEGQAREVAESGLVDALAWLRRQPAQPVLDFSPQRNLAADPPIDETDDPTVGLVRSFEIGPGIWGRYIVRRGGAAEDFEDLNGNGIYDAGEPVYDVDGDGRRTLAYGARDVTALRRHAGVGSAWYLEAEGVVYVRPDASLPLGEGPNRRVARARLATEVRRGTFSFVPEAAVVASRGKDVKVEENTTIQSDSLGLGYIEQSGGPKVDKDANIDAPTPHAGIPGLARGRDPDRPRGRKDRDDEDRLQVSDVFGVDWGELRGMADVGIGWSDRNRWRREWKKERLPYTVPEDGLLVANGDRKHLKKVKFDRKYPLRGRGIVAIQADKVEIKKDAMADFRGILFVDGDLKIEGPATFRGTLIVTGKVEIKGKKGDVTIIHDPQEVRRQVGVLGQYRRAKSSYVPVPHHLDERPDERIRSQRRFGGLRIDTPPLLDDSRRLSTDLQAR